MEIRKELIDEAEKILLPAGSHFDDERRDFIANFTSHDLVAVPGSGKTTALQAKLYCLSKSLPFDSGAGILVLSHTNAAVEEVKSKLAFVAPQLFSYPCAVITVQEFVDRFLALPFYTNIFKVPIIAIDGARYIEAIERYMSRVDRTDYARIIWNLSRPENNPFYRARFYYDTAQGKSVLSGSVAYSELNISLPDTWKRTAGEKDAHIREVIHKMKVSIMKDGILNYDDCYFLATVYLSKHPEVKTYLRKRFPYVFVDETQDLKQYQLDILSQLFDSDDVTIQRIGDHNQAIFSSGDEGDCEWRPQNQQTLKNSLRLSPMIANKVNPFMLNRVSSGGEEVFVNGNQPKPLNIPPYLLLYDAGDSESLKSTYTSLIAKHELLYHSDARYGFHIIGWNASYSSSAKPGKDRKPRLEEIFSEFKHLSVGKLNSRATLSDYLNAIRMESTTKEMREELLNAICRAVSLAGARMTVKTARGDISRHYSPTSFMARTRESADRGLALDTVLYQSLFNLQKEKRAESFAILKKYIEGPVLELLGVNTNQQLQAFLGDDYQDNTGSSDSSPRHEIGGVPIIISTVHAAKGQTHCATMYVETSFYDKFESEWLITKKKATKRLPPRLEESPFFGDSVDPQTEGARKAMKMIYVGFSRPRQLLCYASWKSLWSKDRLLLMQECGWKIIDVTSKADGNITNFDDWSLYGDSAAN